MMMGPSKPPKPDTRAINDALSLLLVLGGNNKASARLLQEMKDVQEKNSVLFVQAKDAVVKAQKEQKDAEAALAALKLATDKSNADLDKRDLDLERKKADLEANTESLENLAMEKLQEARVRLEKLDANESALLKRERDYNEKIRALDKRDSALVELEDALEKRLEELNERDKRLKVALGV
jgi:hypothetical protein